MSNYGLVRVIPGSELQKQNEILPDEVPEVTESELTREIRRHWETNRNAKLRVEEELLEDLRAKNGRYHPQKLTQIRQMGGSEIYMMITATKMRAAASWIKDIVLPDDDKAWGIDPTTIPDLPEWAEKAVRERIMQKGGGEMELMQLREMLNVELNSQAKTSAEAMEDKITDQLEESKWHEMINQVIDDFTTFSATIIKGPMVSKVKSLKWKSAFGNIKPVATDERIPGFSRVSPFDAYPAPHAQTVNDGAFIEHIRYERAELWNLIGTPGYREDQIRMVLDQYSAGLREWLWQDTERNENERKHNWWRDQRNGLIDALHFWGPVQGRTLTEWGLSVDDPMQEYQIDAILIGRYLIRININTDPLARRPYHKACYDPVPGSFWGNSIRYLMADIQEFCNATARALVNNMAMASGPMVEVNYERLSPLEDELDIYPWKIWQTRGAEIGQGNTVQFFQPESNAHELMSVYERFELKADDATSIPRYSHGNEKVGGAGSTASGLSMLLNSAAKGIKAAIGNFDIGITRPAIEMMYYYNMMTSRDMSIKGDCKVVARGANALLLKDMAQARRNEFLSMTANPIDMEIIGKEGRASILRKVADDFDLKGIVPSREVIRQRIEQELQNPQPTPEQVKIQGEMEIEKIKQEGEARRLEIELDFKESARQAEMEKIGAEKEIKLEELRVKKEVEMEKQRRQEAMEIRLMEEETRRLREKIEINAEADIEKHALSLDFKGKEQEYGLDLKEKNSAPALTSEQQAPSAPPMNLTIAIDNKTGKVRKTVKINRDGDRLVDGMDIEEQEVMDIDE